MADASAARDGALARTVISLPKAEVHLHLEGCVPPELVARKARAAGAVSGRALPVRDLSELLSYLDWSCGLIDHPDELATIAYETMRRAQCAGVRHVDAIVNPTHWPHFAGRLQALVGGFTEGFTAAETEGLGSAALCLSLKRTQTALEAEELVRWILQSGEPLVTALSIDGNEHNGAASHTERFRPAFKLALDAGLRRCVHAGESSGAGGVRDAIDALHAERIDHGIRCIEDPALPSELAARGIPLDLCPHSNVALGVVASLASHPVEALRRAGVRFSLNTDDPLLYGIDVVGEYVSCARQFSWDDRVLVAIARTSIESCFASEARRRELLGELEAWTAPRD